MCMNTERVFGIYSVFEESLVNDSSANIAYITACYRINDGA